ncbi:MAG: CPBP family intramembrane glutamic endopeptidase [Bacteroidota bacterium]
MISGKYNYRSNFFKYAPISISLHILFGLLGIVLPALLFGTSYRRRQEKRVAYWSEEMKIRLYYGNGLLLWGLAALVLAIWYLTDHSFTELGLGWGEAPYDLTAVLVLACFALLYLFDIYREIGNKDRQEESRSDFAKLGFLPASAKQFLHFIFLAVAAGICEEIIYRGFMVTYLLEILGTSPLATLGVLGVPAIAFGLGHFYQGGQAVLKIIIMAILFGFFFWRTNTLWPLMLLHTAIDIFGGVMSWWLLSRELGS